MKYLLIMLGLLIGASTAHAQEKAEMDEMWGDQGIANTAPAADKTALFADGNYAMFIHWGLYSKIANQWDGKTYYGISEWIMNPRRAEIPAERYMAEAATFNPVDFDAEAIVRLAKDAGMKYIIITSKHHDGFAMYDSDSNDFNIVEATPFARDPMKELADACAAADLGFGFYYSHNQDWTFPGGNGGPATNAAGEEVGFDYYFQEKCLPQVKEITTKYGDIALVWFDTPGKMEKKYVEELVAVVQRNQPNALVSGRAGHGLGDYKSFGDMNIPEENVPGLWESVDVTNDSWGYAWYDDNWKSPKRILKSVISTVARGGTYMLNVGPDPTGKIPEPAQAALRASGDWIQRHSSVIYAAGPSPWGHALPFGDATTQGNKISLCVYDWPLDGRLYLPGLENKITAARLLGAEKPVALKADERNGWTVLELPARRPDKLVAVIELEVEGTPRASHGWGVDPVYATAIPVGFATADDCVIKEKRWMEKFGEWKHVSQAQDWTEDASVTWEVEIMEAGAYQVDLNYAGKDRMVWRVAQADGTFIQNEQNASHIYNYFEMGLLYFDRPGKHTVTVSLVDGDRGAASLKEIRFTPLASLE